MPQLFPQTAALPEALGFRTGKKGVHNSRTLTLKDLTTLLQHLPADAPNAAYRAAAEEDNVLAKKTASTRHYVVQRLSQLYGLDPSIPLFRTFRALWDESDEGRPLLALLLALARDPILRTTAPPILGMDRGDPLDKDKLAATIKEVEGERFNETSIRKITQMSASSWTQSGHLKGRSNKIRQRPTCTVTTTAYALLLGYMAGLRGQLLFDTLWIEALDAPEHEVHEYAHHASRRGLLTYRNAGGIIEVDFSPILTSEEAERIREQS